MCAAVLGIVLSIAFLTPFGWQSTKAFVNQIFEQSEQVNSYVYGRLEVEAQASPALAQCLFGGCFLLLLLLVYLVPARWPAVLLAVIAAAGQAYFGLSLPVAMNILLYGLLAGKILIRLTTYRAIVPFAGCILVVSLLVTAAFPGTNMQVENASEAVRDWLGTAAVQPQAGGAEEKPEQIPVRYENRRDLLAGEQEAATEQEYRRVTVEEQQIGQPHWIDYLRIALLCLLIPVCLAAPFVPFIWLNKRNKRIMKRLEWIEAEDHNEAARGFFDWVIGYLDACQIGSANTLYMRRFSQYVDAVPAEYRQLFEQCAAVWQKMVYGTWQVTDEERAGFEKLLEETERLCYDQAPRKTRLRLKYRYCLHE